MEIVRRLTTPDLGLLLSNLEYTGDWDYAGEGKMWDGSHWGGNSPKEFPHPDVTVEDFNKAQEHLVAGRPIHLAGYLE